MEFLLYLKMKIFKYISLIKQWLFSTNTAGSRKIKYFMLGTVFLACF